MPDPVVEKFKVTGEVAVWRYRHSRALPGWHFSCDDAAGDCLLKLAELMQAARFPSRKRISISVNPLLTKAPGGSDIPYLAKSFEIRFFGDFAPDHWDISESEGNVILALGSQKLRAFRSGISDILKGRGDYAIGDNPELWFWWKSC